MLTNTFQASGFRINGQRIRKLVPTISARLAAMTSPDKLTLLLTSISNRPLGLRRNAHAVGFKERESLHEALLVLLAFWVAQYKECRFAHDETFYAEDRVADM